MKWLLNYSKDYDLIKKLVTPGVGRFNFCKIELSHQDPKAQMKMRGILKLRVCAFVANIFFSEAENFFLLRKPYK